MLVLLKVRWGGARVECGAGWGVIGWFGRGIITEEFVRQSFSGLLNWFSSIWKLTVYPFPAVWNCLIHS